MILIVNNGKDYSDHSIYFVEVPSHLTQYLGDIRALVAALGDGWGVEAAAERVEWFVGRPVWLTEFLFDRFDYLDWCDDEERARLPRISEELARHLAASWPVNRPSEIIKHLVANAGGAA